MKVSSGKHQSRRDGRSTLARLLDGARTFVDDIRIREHLRRAETDLRAAGREHLGPDQRRRRETQLDRLREYRQRGEFPRNRITPERSPCFVGANGTPCAVAHLLLEDGRADLVEHVAETDPTVRIESLDDGPVLEWLETNGLTRDEAARIQPSYPYSVEFATSCGPLPCWLAAGLASLVALVAFALAEYVGVRVAADRFPENTLERRSAAGYFTVANAFAAALVAVLLYALFP